MNMLRLGPAGAILLSAMGCGSAVETPGMAGASVSAAASSAGTGGSGSGTTSTSGTGGQIVGLNVTGTVSTLGDTTLNGTSPYPGPATVTAARAGGGTVSGSYSDPPPYPVSDVFKLEDVDPATDLFLLTPGPSDEVMPTLTLQHAKAGVDQPMTIWGLKRSVLEEIAASLSTAPKVDFAKAHLLFVGGQGPGIAIKNVPPGATVAYGQDAGTYSDTATATGASGLIVVFNVTVPDAGIADVVVEENNVQGTQHVPVQVGVATIDGYI